jgi:hypothetical protein
MHRKWFAIFSLCTTALLLLHTSGCGHNHDLASITVTPSTVTINLTSTDRTVPIQFTALGNYVHPFDTRDITKTVVWATDTPDAFTISSTTPGLYTTTGTVCGSNLGVSASVYSDPSNPPAGRVVVGTASVSITGC